MTDTSTSLRRAIEAVLFTAPGERPLHPEFGTPLGRLMPGAVGEPEAAAVAWLARAALQRWLGDRILVEALRVTPEPAALDVEVRYVRRADGERERATFRLEA